MPSERSHSPLSGLISYIRLISGRRGGIAVIIAGISIFILSVVLAAAVAPNVGVAADDRRVTIVGSQGGGPGLHDGGSVYQLTGQSIAWQLADADSYFDVTKLSDGTILAGYMNGETTQCGPYDEPCARTGFRVINSAGMNVDETPTVTDEYSFPVRTRVNSEVHDVEQLGPKKYIFTDMDAERVAIVDNGRVTWEWYANTTYDEPSDPTQTDWLHINDIDVIDSDRFLVSVRNAHQLVIIERGQGVVEVINKDQSGNGKGDPSILRQQHNPQWLGNGTVLVADSHNDRIVELHRGADNHWEVTWSITAAEGVPFSWPRDADRLSNGNTLITDSLNKRIVEINSSGAAVWSYQTQKVPYEADRLPGGERVGGVAYTDIDTIETTANTTTGQNIPILSLLLTGVQTGIQTPFWFTEIHVATGVMAVISVIFGSGLIIKNR
ncbi:hypothetical protein [Haloquadratum walsbyi]|jgi:hypothetical protein|uniref:Arylsulfotransferase (ASST) n=1 Tax=Haloquadratum walsbyi J07HQW2 TaxID=1238425 RepID=U1NFC0_9EURY|nr:hypothetical protein [Haloquadratum walsbyi]ERG95493.1 MAG: hypothetical protein J07HQW2_01950 [Haloquadratum walsbyi J07HQW2]